MNLNKKPYKIKIIDNNWFYPTKPVTYIMCDLNKYTPVLIKVSFFYKVESWILMTKNTTETDKSDQENCGTSFLKSLCFSRYTTNLSQITFLAIQQNYFKSHQWSIESLWLKKWIF